MTSPLASAWGAALRRRAERAKLLPVDRKSIIQGGQLIARNLVGRPLPPQNSLTSERAIENFFKTSALVYRPVMALATAAGSIRWQVEVKSGGDWQNDEDHDLQALLDKPHKFFSRQDWNEVLVMHLILTGNALSLKVPLSGSKLSGAALGRIGELVPVIPEGIKPIPSDTDWISGYLYEANGRRIKWRADEVLHFMLRDPSNLYWGMSPLQAAKSIVSMDLGAVVWNLTSLQNRTVSDAILSTEQPLTGQQYEDALDQVYDQFTGNDVNHLPKLVTGGVTYQALERTPVEMDFNETRKTAREEILSDLFVPPVMAGYFDNATLANAEVSRRIFWEDNVIPVLIERIAGGLNASVVPHFGAPDKLRVSYDISSIPALREDLVKKFAMLGSALRSGVPYNEAIAELELDLEPIDDLGDRPFGLDELRPKAGAQVGATPSDAADGLGEQDVQVSTAAVLSGAQITAATAIVTAVAAGEMPRDSGLGQLRVLFNLDEDQAAAIMGSAGTATPTVANPKPAAEAGPPADDLAEGKAFARPAPGRAAKATLGVATGVLTTTFADEAAPAARAAILSSLSRLRGGASLADLRSAVEAGDAAAALARLGSTVLPEAFAGALSPSLSRAARASAGAAAEQLAAQIGGDALALDAGRLSRWLQPYLRERAAQLTGATEAGVREFFADLAAGRLGENPAAAASLLRDSWGLTQQQGAGVRNLYRSLLDRGKSPSEAARTAGDFAKRRVVERAARIAEHESMVAANRGNGALWEQALDEGTVKDVIATWFTNEDGDVDEECVSLADQEIAVGGGDRFVGASGETYREPPAHPACRCGVLYSAIV